MKLKLEKFGKTLISRELGSEAFKAFQPTLRKLASAEELEIVYEIMVNKRCGYLSHCHDAESDRTNKKIAK